VSAIFGMTLAGRSAKAALPVVCGNSGPATCVNNTRFLILRYATEACSSMKRDLYELPKEVGNRRLHPPAPLSFFVVILGTNVVATQVVAARLDYNPTLGCPFAHVADVGLYATLLHGLLWSWRFLEPFGGYDYEHHVLGCRRSYTRGCGRALWRGRRSSRARLCGPPPTTVMLFTLHDTSLDFHATEFT
jgi:hypothetical protein